MKPTHRDEWRLVAMSMAVLFVAVGLIRQDLIVMIMAVLSLLYALEMA